MTSKQEWVDYHVNVFTEYYNSFPEETESMEDVAEGMYALLDSCEAGESNPFSLVNYSAGVYLGLHDSGDADAIAVLPDLSNLEYATDSTDLWEVWRRMDNPDAHADGADAKVEQFIDAVGDNHTPEELEEALYAFMKVACSEYTVVLRAWNRNLDTDYFWKFWKEGHYQSLLTFMGCDT